MEPSSSSSNFTATLRVDQQGGEDVDYVTIAKAIQDAAPGTRIIVEAGNYEECLLINKAVVIVGTSTHVTVQSKKGPCLEVGVDGVVVRGLTFQGFSDADPTVRLYKDTVLEYCDVTSEVCSIATADDAAPTIRRCRINGGGIHFTQNAKGVVEECDIHGNQEVGITAEKKASPVIRNCRILGNQCGVGVWEEADITIENCDIFDHRHTGVDVGSTARATVRRCCIHHCQAYALSFWEQAKVIVEDCEVYSNRWNGLCVDQNSSVSFRRCKIHGCAVGIVVKENGTGVVDQCEVYENAHNGVLVMSGHLTVERSRIHHQLSGSGLQAGTFPTLGEAKVVVQGCEITDNASSGVCVENGGDVEISDSTITGNETAIEKNFGGNVSVTNCNLPDDDSEGEETDGDDDDCGWDDDDDLDVVREDDVEDDEVTVKVGKLCHSCKKLVSLDSWCFKCHSCPECCKIKGCGTQVEITIPGQWCTGSANDTGVTWNDEGVITPATVVCRPGEPYQLKISDNATIDDLAKLRDICDLTSLQAIDFDDFELTDAGMVHLGNLLTLKGLDLGQLNQVTDTGLAHLGGLTALESLSLGSEQVTDSGIAHISRLSGLKRLSIHSCKHVTDAGLRHLGRLNALRKLAIFGCEQLTDAGLVHLERLQSLEMLFIRCCERITEAGLARLQHSLPKCALW